MKSKLNGFVVVLVLVVALGACSKPMETTPAPSLDPTTTSVIVPTAQPEAAVPVPQSDDAAYPGPDAESATVDFGSYPAPVVMERVHPRTQFPDGPLTVPVAKTDTGVVRGRLVADEVTELALFTGDIYLGPVVYMEGETRVPFLSLDEAGDPKAILRNSDNEFIVTDVPPGEYGIIIHTPVSDIVVPEAEFGFLIIEVVAGQVIDLGDLLVE